MCETHQGGNPVTTPIAKQFSLPFEKKKRTNTKHQETKAPITPNKKSIQLLSLLTITVFAPTFRQFFVMVHVNHSVVAQTM
jgi:hypothetical protein